MSLPFSTSKVLIGSPQTIKKVIGNGLIPFLAADGNLYLVDVVGNVTAFSNYAGGGVVADINYVSIGGETQIPNYVDVGLKKASSILFFMEGALLTSGTQSDEYADTSQLGYLTLNFTAPADNRFRIIGFGAGSGQIPGGFNAIINTQITSPQTNLQLNALYPNASAASIVFCPNIVGGGLMYVYNGDGTWDSSLLTKN